MAENTKIEWADSTMNPWMGCTKVSAACDHCYAERLGHRFGVQWGNHPRQRTVAPWDAARSWNRTADKFERLHGRPRYVFCASMADVFDNQVPDEWRRELWELIAETPRLIWLLLTKRPQNIETMLPADWGDGWRHVWLGTTVENQAEADRRIPHLLAVPAAKRFLSCEPLLGPVDLVPWLPIGYECSASCGWRGHEPADTRCYACGHYVDGGFPDECPDCGHAEMIPVCPSCNSDTVTQHPDTVCIDWVIAGGESGREARPSHPDWFRSLRDQCAGAGVPFLFKQWGEWSPQPDRLRPETLMTFICPDGEILTHPMDRLEEKDVEMMWRLGKVSAGRLLDGIQHDERPQP